MLEIDPILRISSTVRPIEFTWQYCTKIALFLDDKAVTVNGFADSFTSFVSVVKVQYMKRKMHVFTNNYSQSKSK